MTLLVFQSGYRIVEKITIFIVFVFKWKRILFFLMVYS